MIDYFYNNFFLLFFLIVVFSLTSVFLSVNTVYSTFNLILVFFLSSISLFSLDFEFMSIIYTTIYVGAVSIFFIFVLMTINIRFETSVEYNDEVFLDKNFSFFVLLVFSALIQKFFFIEFKNFLYIRDLIDLYVGVESVFFKSNASFSVNKALNFETTPMVLNSVTNNFNMQIYYDINIVGFSLYDEMQLIFLVITYLLLFAMLSSIGFAVRSR